MLWYEVGLDLNKKVGLVLPLSDVLTLIFGKLRDISELVFTDRLERSGCSR